MKRRIFIESDILHKDALRNVQREVADYLDEKKEKYIKNIFDETLDFAWHDLEKTWKAVKGADEIYADSSLMPLVGNSYMGAPVIFNGMMERAIKENITGKSVFILRKFKDIYWHMIEVKMMRKTFKNNKLFMRDEDYNIVEMNVTQLVKNIKS